MKIIARLLFILALSMVRIIGYSQTNGRDIIVENDLLLGPIGNVNEKTFTPTADEINKAKELSVRFIDSILRSKNDTVVLSKVQNCYRQYLCYVNLKKNKIIMINVVSLEQGKDLNLKKIWIPNIQIKVNLSNNSCFDYIYNKN